MKKFIKLLCLGLALVFISGCESKDSMEDITIYTSMYPIEYVTKQIYGEHTILYIMDLILKKIILLECLIKIRN